MKRSAYLCGGSALVMALSLGLAASAYAADAEEAPATSEEVVVTGSFIRGTPEDAALPVDVIGADEIQKQGSPSTVELLKALTVSNGVLGDTNQFDSRAQGSEGSGSVNLRGLGPARTLVLMNGRRLSINPLALAGSGAVDTNILPSAAMGRLEVLKDGAAATYGSDAIGGVVNFITKTNFDGLELAADYRFIKGSDGDYNMSLVYGKMFDNGNLLFSVGYNHRSELSVRERDWAHLPYLANPEGGWSAAGNPESYLPYGPVGVGGAYSPTTATISRDAGCAALGGYTGFSATTPVCQWQYTLWDNLVEKTDMLQMYGEVNFNLSDTTKFHGEVLYSKTNVPEWKTSPSYAALSNPSVEPYTATAGTPLAGNPATLAGIYYVPNTNPGLIAYLAQNSLTLPAGSSGVRLLAFRPYALGGNPMFGYGPSTGKREYEAFRVVGDLSGEWNGIGWDAALTYSQEVGERSGYDTMVNRFELALRGLGGEGCNPLTGVAGVGACQYYNPFSNAIPSNAITGVANPNYQSAVSNSAALTRWFFKEVKTKQYAKLFVGDFVLNGKTGITFPGGDLAWAAGVQYRRSSFQSRYDNLSNQAASPCVASPDFGNNVCSGAQANGPLVFLGVGTEADLNNDVWAAFAEFSLPLTDNFSAQIAARYEDFGGATGSTFNPKISLRWQATEWLAFRGSAGSTFRAPPDTSLTNSSVTSLQSIFGTFRAVDIYGNTGLAPEKAKTYSLGAIVKAGGLKATFDWWRFDFENPLVTEPLGGMVAAMFPTSGAGNCGVPAYAALQARFTFSGTCNSANISRVKTFTINGPEVRTSGYDLLIDYDFGDVLFGGDFKVGGSFTYVNEYKTAATTVEGLLVAPAFDAVGLLNYQTSAYPLPQWKGDFHAEWTSGPHNVRATVHYIDKYTDQRTAPFAANAYRDNAGVLQPALTQGKTIDAQVLTDVAYRVFLPWDTTMTVAITNLFDQDPSFARLDLSYDPFTGDALGRTFKFGLRKKF